MSNTVETQEFNTNAIAEPVVNSMSEQSENTSSEGDQIEAEPQQDNQVQVDENVVNQNEQSDTQSQNENQTANNSNDTQVSLKEEDVVRYLKEKGIDIDSLDTIKDTHKDKDIQLFKKYKEISQNGSVEDFIYAKEVAEKKWEEVDKADLVARYLSEVETLQDSHVSRKLKKLAPTPILSEDDFYGSDYTGDYDDYVDAIKDQNIDKEIEFNSLYKQSLSHYGKESAKYKDLFNSEPQQKEDALEDYFVGLSKSVDLVEDINVNDTKIVYTKEEKDFMLSSAEQINQLPAKYFNENGTAKDSKKVLQDFAWLDESFRDKKLKQTWQVAFNAGKEAMIKNKANITLDTHNQATIGNVGLSFDDIIRKSQTKF